MKEFILKNTFDPNKCKIDYQADLNPQQLDAVLSAEGPCLVLAGAGSGKTRTITYRVAYLIENGVSPENILLLTFTNKAAREMLSRVEMLLGSYPTGLWGGTFHSVANRILRKYAKEVGRTSDFTIIDQEDSKGLIKACVKDLAIDVKARRFPSVAYLKDMISYSRNASVGVSDVIERKYYNFLDHTDVIEKISEMYGLRKQTANAMDFDDLLILLSDLLYNNESIRSRLAGQFQYVLVDEYQDTNVVQAGIVRELASHHGNVFVVGDDAQSIYSFRAAQIKNILNFPQMHSDTKIFHLTKNYRSTPQILDLANASIKNNTEQFQKELCTVRDCGDKPNLVPAQSASQEAQYVAEQILELRDEGLALEKIAVLFRAASISHQLEMELMKRDIPYEYRGGMKFFERAHIKDVVSFLRIALNIKDEAAWLRILGLQSGVGLSTAGKIYQSIAGFDNLEQVCEAPIKLGAKALQGWLAFKKIADQIRVPDLSPSEMIRKVASSGYRDYLEGEYPDFMDRLDDIEQFALYAEGYTDLRKFLDEVTLTEEYGASRGYDSGNEEKIVLSTIHQAKGLEWDCVFVIGMTEGRFPNARVLDEEGGLEEERRLFYVATTRARKQLFFTYPITSGYDTLIINQPSVFLQELPQELCEHVRLRHEVLNPQNSWKKRASSDDWEPMIVLNDLGEEE
ncbi:MAG: ATP-dependent helicase [Patescibacteria group bacterium]